MVSTAQGCELRFPSQEDSLGGSAWKAPSEVDELPRGEESLPGARLTVLRGSSPLGRESLPLPPQERWAGLRSSHHVRCFTDSLWGSLKLSTDYPLFFWVPGGITLPWTLDIRCGHVTCHGQYNAGRGDLCRVCAEASRAGIHFAIVLWPVSAILGTGVALLGP